MRIVANEKVEPKIFFRSNMLDDAKIVSKLHSPHVFQTELAKQKQKKDLAESTGVVPAKYPPKIKLERISTTLECQSRENYAYLDL